MDPDTRHKQTQRHRRGESDQNHTRDRARRKEEQIQRDTLTNRPMETRTQSWESREKDQWTKKERH